MSKHFKTSPVVLFLVDGFGLSASWQGNAITSAKPTNFNHYWSSYRHLVIRQPLLNPANPCKNYSLISGVEEPITKKTTKIVSDQVFLSGLDTLKRNNSSIHFFLIFSKNEKKAQNDILQILRTAKSNSVTNAYIHLLLDRSYQSQADLQPDIEAFESSLGLLGLGNIATVTGLGFVKKENHHLLEDMIYSAEGSAIFSLQQAFSRKKNALPFELSPKIVKSSYNSKITDFDMIFTVGTPPENFLDFLKNIILHNSSSSNGKLPKFLHFFGFDEFPFDLDCEIHFINSKDSGGFITDLVKNKGLSQLLVTDADNLKQMNLYFVGDKSQIDQNVVSMKLNSITKEYESTTEEIIKNALAALEKLEYDFIIINLPSLARASSFSQSVEEVKKIDDGLGLIANQVTSCEGYLIFCSAFGRAENLVENTTKVRDNAPGASNSEQTLPFFVLSDSTIKETRKDLFHEILSSSCNLHHINDFLQTILIKDNYQNE